MDWKIKFLCNAFQTERIYKLTDPDTLELIFNMETTTTSHQKHLHITYKKTKD